MTAQRRRLPNRRGNVTETLIVGDQRLTANVGFDPVTNQPRELFLSAAKEGSELDAILADVAVVISVALQHNVPATALAKSVGRIPLRPVTPDTLDNPGRSTQPASPVGAALDLLCKLAASHQRRPGASCPQQEVSRS